MEINHSVDTVHSLRQKLSQIKAFHERQVADLKKEHRKKMIQFVKQQNLWRKQELQTNAARYEKQIAELQKQCDLIKKQQSKNAPLTDDRCDDVSEGHEIPQLDESEAKELEESIAIRIDTESEASISLDVPQNEEEEDFQLDQYAWIAEGNEDYDPDADESSNASSTETSALPETLCHRCGAALSRAD